MGLEDGINDAAGVKTTASLDLAFLMDCTSSMKPQITFCKNKVQDIVNSVRSNFPTAKIRVAFVGYRDFDIPGYPVMDFTPDAKGMADFIDGIPAVGGGDVAEDLAGGLKQLNELSWQQGGSAARMAVLFTDAPAHGTAYHNLTESNDFHMTIPEDQRLEPLMAKLSRRQVDFHMFHLTPHTSKMEGVMTTAYDTGLQRIGLNVIKNVSENPGAMLTELVKAATASLTVASLSLDNKK